MSAALVLLLIPLMSAQNEEPHIDDTARHLLTALEQMEPQLLDPPLVLIHGKDLQ